MDLVLHSTLPLAESTHCASPDGEPPSSASPASAMGSAPEASASEATPPTFAVLRKREAAARLAWAMDCLQAADGNISEAARRAGLDRSNFKKIVRRSAGGRS